MLKVLSWFNMFKAASRASSCTCNVRAMKLCSVLFFKFLLFVERFLFVFLSFFSCVESKTGKVPTLTCECLYCFKLECDRFAFVFKDFTWWLYSRINTLSFESISSSMEHWITSKMGFQSNSDLMNWTSITNRKLNNTIKNYHFTLHGNLRENSFLHYVLCFCQLNQSKIYVNFSDNDKHVENNAARYQSQWMKNTQTNQ